MDNKTVYNAICGIDESSLNEYDTNCKEIKKHRKSVKRSIAFTACFAVFAAGIAIYTAGNVNFTPEIPQTAVTTQQDNVITANAGNENSTTWENAEADTTGSNDNNEIIPDDESDSITEEADSGQDIGKDTSGIKGGDTPEFIQNHSKGSDGQWYRVFHPRSDTFAPQDEMTLENRFCSFVYNGKSYYPAVNGDLTSDDYEPELLRDVIASHYELLTPDEEVVGIEYRARIDIYKLKGIDPDEAVAGVISFRGETKAYRYNAKEISSPSWP